MHVLKCYGVGTARNGSREEVISTTDLKLKQGDAGEEPSFRARRTSILKDSETIYCILGS